MSELLQALSSGVFTFQTFDDNADRKDKRLTQQINGLLDDVKDQLKTLNEQGAGVFVTVNATDGKGRTKANITAVRALFVDFDSMDEQRPARLLGLSTPPSMIIESSQNKHHAYWIADGIKLDDFTHLQKALISYFTAQGDTPDKAVHDLSRVMRLDGFYHHKVKNGVSNAPFLTRVIHHGKPYHAEELITWVDSLAPQNTLEPQESAPLVQSDNLIQSDSLAQWVRNQAQDKWAYIYGACGYDVGNGEHIQCPHCGGKDRFRFDDHNKIQGDGGWICSQGNGTTVGGDGLSFLIDHVGLAPSVAYQEICNALNIDLPSITPPSKKNDKKSGKKDAKNGGKVTLLTASQVKAEPIRWLWHGWLPLGKLTILAGAGGSGKTTIALDLIRAVTTGGKFPDGSICTNTGECIIYSTEDDIADTLTPRLQATGANLDKVFFIDGVEEDGEKRYFDASKDIHTLFNVIKGRNVRLIVIDPILSAITGDMNKANDVRASLKTLVDFAQEHKCAIIGITHFGKGTKGQDPTERILGSQAFSALARMNWVTAPSQSPDEPNFFGKSKTNIAKIDGGFEYFIEPCQTDGINTTRIKWGNFKEGNTRQLLNEVEGFEEGKQNSLLDEAKEFLIELLREKGEMKAKEVEAMAKDASITPKTLRNAREIVCDRPSKKSDGVWYWRLKSDYKLKPSISKLLSNAEVFLKN